MRGAGRRRFLVVCLLLGWAGLLVACSGSDDDEGSATSSTARRSTTTTEAPTVEEQVEAAYLRSWDVYARAVRELDPNGLEEVYAEDALETVRNEVARRSAENAPVRVTVDHNHIVQVRQSRTDAIVFDRYDNRSVKVDPRSGEPVEPVQPETEHAVYELKLLGGRWKVVRVSYQD